jgi:hypothetical protein
VDAVLAYQPPAVPEGPERLTAARRAFDAALERAKPLLAAQGIRVIGVRTYRDGPPSNVVMLDVVALGLTRFDGHVGYVVGSG